MFEFEMYKDRQIAFIKTVSSNNWSIKIYSVTNKASFTAHKTLAVVEQEIPAWVAKAGQSKLPTHNNAFIIVHEAREGVLILFSWWTGGEMLETEVYFSSFQEPEKIVASPYAPRALVCVWELQVFAHERQAWIDKVLKKATAPDFPAYINDVVDYRNEMEFST